jgi:hypothetical protein
MDRRGSKDRLLNLVAGSVGDAMVDRRVRNWWALYLGLAFSWSFDRHYTIEVYIENA